MFGNDLIQWLVLGAAGQLGTEVVERLRASGQQTTAVTRQEVDICNADQVSEVLDLVQPSCVINAAAYTNVDEAENSPGRAFEVNAHGPGVLAAAVANRSTACLVHVSTDYVFGHVETPGRPWLENDPLSPLNEYGRTKAQGEMEVRRLLPHRSAIVRTAWLYAPGHRNFVATMVDRARADAQSLVVSDQWGQPTWARDAADLIVELASRLGRGQAPAGTYHATNSGRATWYEFARCIYRKVGAPLDLVVPITSGDLVRAAARPSWSVLGHDAWHRAGMSPPRRWHEALGEALPLFLVADKSSP